MTEAKPSCRGLPWKRSMSSMGREDVRRRTRHSPLSTYWPLWQLSWVQPTQTPVSGLQAKPLRGCDQASGTLSHDTCVSLAAAKYTNGTNTNCQHLNNPDSWGISVSNKTRIKWFGWGLDCRARPGEGLCLLVSGLHCLKRQTRNCKELRISACLSVTNIYSWHLFMRHCSRFWRARKRQRPGF